MNLQKCKAHNDTIIKVPCCNCSTVKEISTMFADLDGEPLRSYYCESCTNDVESAILDEQQELLSKGQE